MPIRRRKIEVHNLIISGLPHGIEYDSFLQQLRQKVTNLGECEWKYRGKSHALISANDLNGYLWMRFYTYTQGHRPDVIDTLNHNISGSPYKKSQAGLEYTNILGSKINDKYYLLIEKVQSGIWPSAIESYLQWLVDEYYQPEKPLENDKGNSPITISLEPDPSEEFIQLMNSLDRVIKATVRISRPNPGWSDLETELGKESQASDAHKSEITMTSRRNKTLSKKDGIIKAIQDLYKEGQLNYARIEGWHGNTPEKFSTEKLNNNKFIKLEIDDDGQVIESSAREAFQEIMRSLKKTKNKTLERRD
jgi:hypothetical protein